MIMRFRNSYTKSIVIMGILLVFLLGALYLANVRGLLRSNRPAVNDGSYSLSRFETLRVHIPKEDIFLKCFKAQDGVWYAFLPSFCNNDLTLGMELESPLSNDEICLKYEPVGVESEYREYSISFEENADGGNLIESGILRVMHSGNIPCMFINTESGNCENIDADKNNIENMDVTVFDTTGKLLFTDVRGLIFGHGNRSFSKDKKPYTITLSKEAPLFGMHTSDKWILISNVCDGTGIQNAITYNMARNAGMNYVPKFQYVDLYLNSMYHGTYLVVEKMEIGEDNMEYTDLNRINKALNPKLISDPESMWIENEYEKGYKLSKNPDDISGGYLIERDYGSKFIDEKSGFVTEKFKENYSVKCPTYASIEQVEYIRNLMNGFEEALDRNDGSWVNYIDGDSFVDKYFVEEFTQNEGAGSTSAFYYKPQDSVSSLIYAGPVWDYDSAYISAYGAPNKLCYSALHPQSPTKIYYLLYKDDIFQNLVKEKYKNFYSDYIGSGLQEDILYYEDLCADTFRMNAIRWGDLDYSYISAAREVSKYIGERKKFLDRIWVDDEPIVTVRFIGWGTYEWNYSVLPGTTIADPIVAADVRWVNVETGECFDSSKPIMEDAEYMYELNE